jgi:tricorn protease
MLMSSTVVAAACAAAAPANNATDANRGLCRYPDVSQDSIVFVYGNDLWLVPKSGGVARPVASPAGFEGSPRFSPDGQTIAFRANYDQSLDLYTIPAAGGIPERDIRAVAQVAIGGRWPDLNVLFDVDTETAMKRLNPLLDRMEGKGMDFHRRVRDGYLAEAHRDPKRHLVIDASRSPDEVFEQLINGLRRWSESFSSAVAG